MITILSSERINPELNQWAADWASYKLFGDARGFGPCATMCVMDGPSNVVAVMVYHNYHADAGTIEISGAADDRRWLTRSVLWNWFNNAFNLMGCQAVIMRVSTKPEQEHIHRMCKAYGFEHHMIPRLRGRNEDEFIFVLYDDVWKNSRFNRHQRRSTDFSRVQSHQWHEGTPARH
jgi:hypothetical protein